jgi:LmbE family N-acetylglucosaminyl deacetylase
MRVLAIGAHPDDIEIGCGGTLLKYAQHGHEVFLLVMTEGSGGGEGATRRVEQETAAAALQAARIYWGDYPDTALPLNRALIQRLEEIISEIRPSFIFVHYPDDTHQDHRHLATCTVTATRYSRNVLFYEGPTTQNFSPSVFVDIESQLSGKIASLEAHASQVTKTNIEGLNIVDIARSASHFRGIQGRVRNGEGFVPLRLFINIGAESGRSGQPATG